MTHYYYDPKTNTLNGPLDRMPPEPVQYFPNQGDDRNTRERDFYSYDNDLAAFDVYLQTLPSHPHTFSGPSRVVPEAEIEWRYEVRGTAGAPWKVVTKDIYDKPGRYRRRVATPITEEVKEDINHGETCYCNACASKRRLSEEASIPAHIVDDMKLDSYYDGFKDGANITGYTSTSGEEEGDPFIQKHLAIIKTKMKQNQEIIKKSGELIDKHIKPLFNGLQKASVQYFVEKGTISGAFYEALTNMVIEAIPEPLTAQPLTTDEDAAKEYADRFYKVLPYDHYESDYDYRTQVAKNKQVQEHFLAGCTHIRSQQQGEIEMLKLKIKQLESNIEDLKHPF